MVNLDKKDKVVPTLFFYFFILSLVGTLIFISERQTAKDTIVNESRIFCANPIFNDSDGFWYCDLDDVLSCDSNFSLINKTDKSLSWTEVSDWCNQ